jgi:hypothetical protein
VVVDGRQAEDWHESGQPHSRERVGGCPYLSGRSDTESWWITDVSLSYHSEQLDTCPKRLAQQLQALQGAVSSAEGTDSSRERSSPSQPLEPHSAQQQEPEETFMALGDHYQQALDQALELYALTDPDASEDLIQSTAMEVAWKDTLGEAVRLYRARPNPEDWPEGWAGVMVEAQEEWAKDNGAQLQTEAAVKTLPGTRRNRSRQDPTAAGPSAATRMISSKSTAISSVLPPTTSRSSMTKVKDEPPDNDQGLDPGFRWRLLIRRIQARTRWSDWGRLLNYSKYGCPKNLDGPAKGFGKHLGRWDWREIGDSW